MENHDEQVYLVLELRASDLLVLNAGNFRE